MAHTAEAHITSNYTHNCTISYNLQHKTPSVKAVPSEGDWWNKALQEQEETLPTRLADLPPASMIFTKHLEVRVIT